MSSSMALLKRASKFIHPVRYVSSSVPSFSRSFNRSAELTSDSSDTDEELNMIERHRSDSLGHYRRGYAPYLYSGEAYVLDPFAFAFAPPSCFNGFAPPICFNGFAPDVMDNYYSWNPFAVGGDPRGGGERSVSAACLRRAGWNVGEDEDACYLKVDMPGLGKEHVKVSVEKNTLVIKAEGEKEDGDDEENAAGRRYYSSRIDLPEDMCKIGEIKAEMKNGVLKVSLPKVKVDERKDVVVVNVQ